jgi:hypothetical protein
VKSQKDKDLAVEAERFWEEITKQKHTYEFERRKKKELEMLPKIELEEFKKHIIFNTDSPIRSSWPNPNATKPTSSAPLSNKLTMPPAKPD